MSDGIWLLGSLFSGSDQPPCGDGTPGDPANIALLNSNDDSEVDVSDAIYIFTFLFLGGPPPILGMECVPIAGCPPVCSD